MHDCFRYALDIEESSPTFQRAVRKRSEAISSIEAMAAAPVELESEDRYQLMLRLAHLQHEQARATHDDRLLTQAAKLYARLLKDQPQHAQSQHVMFFLGFALQSLGQDGAVLNQLLRDYPSSEYVPHALLHTGEAEFAEEDWEEAGQRYARAVDYSFPFRDFALYKLAWTLRKRGDTRAAVDTMALAVRDARPALSKVALTALVYWSEEQGWPLDTTVTTPTIQPSCLDDIPAERAAITAAPMAAEAVHRQHAIVICVADRAPSMLQAEVRRMQATYARGSSWWKLQDKQARRDAKTLAQDAESLLQ